MIEAPVMCDADVWIKMVSVGRPDLIFRTFKLINMVGIVVREIRCFNKSIFPGKILDGELKKKTIRMYRQKDFPDETKRHFKFLIAEYRRKHKLDNRKNLGEIVSAIMAQETKIPIIVSDDSFVKELKRDFDLTLYDHYYILKHCEEYLKILNKKEADELFSQIEELGSPKKQSRDLLKKLRRI